MDRAVVTKGHGAGRMGGDMDKATQNPQGIEDTARAPQHAGPVDGRRAEEDALIRRRHEQVGLPKDSPSIGLALSGGGIRSATFCLGVIRALAKNRVLHQFDYLSTVSGGGYIGAMLGRLFGPHATPAQIEEGIDTDGSLLMWWLRSNGRYLIPAGSRDMFQAWAGQARGFVATQFEVAVLLALASCVVIAPHLSLQVWVQDPVMRGIATYFWFWCSLAMAWGAVVAALGYWWIRDEEDTGHTAGLVTTVLAAAMSAATAWWAFRQSTAGAVTGWLVAAAFIAAIPASQAFAAWRTTPGSQGSDRVMFTRHLTRMLGYAMALAAIGLFDRIGWFLADVVLPQAGLAGVGIGGLGGLLAIVVTLARVVLPMLQSRDEKPGAIRLPVLTLANLFGLLTLLVLLVGWLALWQYVVFHADAPGVVWLAVAGLTLLYVVSSGANLQQINRASLHLFYRSRLARTYVSVGNFAQDPAQANERRFPTWPLAPNLRELTLWVRKVTQLSPGDDIAIDQYRPHEHGGPIHLINCCVNQTIDDRTRSFNADRKGVCLTVSSLGIETGTRLDADPSLDRLKRTTLAQWVAISGAAVGSGVGSMTKPGIAILSFLSGLRLGYWWTNRVDKMHWSWRRLGKYRATLQEMLARFPGLKSPVWYVSDGGHFDNTGVYALLKRQLQLIVMVDCGADPKCLFADVENLVRKARIDYGATIRFIDPASIDGYHLPERLRGRFGTPDSVLPCPGTENLLLATIDYEPHRQGEPARHGTLLVIKPRCDTQLPLDVAGYADRDRGFPQQGTVDQFFDEAQWESYYQLGRVIADPIDVHLLAALPDWARAGTPVGTGAITPEEQRGLRTRRDRFGTVVRSTVGLGAAATLVLAVWQVWDSQAKQSIESQRLFAEGSRELAAQIVRNAADKPYDPALDTELQLFAAGLDDRQRARHHELLRGLAEVLWQRCAAVPQLQQDRCRSATSKLTRHGDSRWHRSMRDYAALWPSVSVSTLFDSGALRTAMRTRSTDSAGTSAPAPASAPRSVTGGAATDSAPAIEAMQEGGDAAKQAAQEVAEQAVANAVVRQCGENADGRSTVYTQIHDEATRRDANKVLAGIRALGIAAPDIEDVDATARRNNRATPFRWPQPTLLYSGRGSACAIALRRWLIQWPGFAETKAISLPPALSGKPDVIELWVPPLAQSQATSPPTRTPAITESIAGT